MQIYVDPRLQPRGRHGHLRQRKDTEHTVELRRIGFLHLQIVRTDANIQVTNLNVRARAVQTDIQLEVLDELQIDGSVKLHVQTRQGEVKGQLE